MFRKNNKMDEIDLTNICTRELMRCKTKEDFPKKMKQEHAETILREFRIRKIIGVDE